MRIYKSANDLLSNMIQWRRSIHKNAELSFNEYVTQVYIESILDIYDIAHERVAGTGVLAKVNSGFAHQNGDQIGVLRADIDALEITERSGVDFACGEGVMHACGHDMHTAALLGALVLYKQSGCKKEVWGLFQPAEELHPGGASIVLESGVFDGVDVKWFLAEHCSPELTCGVVGVRGGQFMASTDEIHIKVNGIGGHGAMPHLSKDAVLAASSIVVSMQQINSRNNNPFTSSVISFGRFIADGATNVLPDSVVLEGTFRTMSESWRSKAHTLIKQVAQFTAKAHQCEAEVEIKHGYPSVFNDLEMVERFRNIGTGFAQILDIEQRMTAEDFGFYSQKYPSLMFRLGVGGSGHDAALHTPRFNPDERALAIGSALLAQFAIEN